MWQKFLGQATWTTCSECGALTLSFREQHCDIYRCNSFFLFSPCLYDVVFPMHSLLRTKMWKTFLLLAAENDQSLRHAPMANSVLGNVKWPATQSYIQQQMNKASRVWFGCVYMSFSHNRYSESARFSASNTPDFCQNRENRQANPNRPVAILRTEAGKPNSNKRIIRLKGARKGYACFTFCRPFCFELLL